MMKHTMQSWAMHYRQIVILLTSCLVALGIYGLADINKNEFPAYTIREGLVTTVYPGADSKEVEQQITKPLEEKIFQYKEVDKTKTTSHSVDGMSMITVAIKEGEKNPASFWNKLKHDMLAFQSELPEGVVGVQVDDDFGDVSTILLTLESKTKTYRELKWYMDQMCDTLRKVKSVGRLAVYGMVNEQVSIYIDNNRLQHYGINDQQVAQKLADKGYVTSGGRLKTKDETKSIYVARSANDIYALENTIVYADGDRRVRLKDVARVVRECPTEREYITVNGNKCLLLSVELAENQDVSAMGAQVNEKLSRIEKVLPKDVKIYKVTDKSQIVDDSIDGFLKEMLIAIISVVLVVIILMPLRVALVATFTIPVTIFVSLGLFWVFDIELNTVTLAAMIVTLGMIVDDAIVIIDGYMDLIAEGMSRWHASIASTRHFYKSILSATMAITITFFPFLIFTSAGMSEFIESFPYAIFIVLFISMYTAQLFIPIVQYVIIRKPIEIPHDGKKHFSMLQMVQNGFDWLVDLCFAHKRTTAVVGCLSVALGIYLMSILPQEQMPLAERNQFAVEIYTPQGTSLRRTAMIADSIEQRMRKDERVVSIVSFKGMSSPRFNDQYAPQGSGSNFAQYIVNTTGAEATNELVEKFQKEYSTTTPDAYVRIKQLSYSEEDNPIEVRLTGDNLDSLNKASMAIMKMMRKMPDLLLVRSDLEEPAVGEKIVLDEEQSGRLGVSNKDVEQLMMMRYSDGVQVGKIWQGDYGMNVMLKNTRSDDNTIDDLLDERINVAYGLGDVPLRQIAHVVPVWQYGSIGHRNGLRTVTVKSETQSGKNVIDMTDRVIKKISGMRLPEGVSVSYGGKYELDNASGKDMYISLLASVIIIFFILLWHFKRIRISVLMLCCLPLTILGGALGTIIVGTSFGITSMLGMISLMGILVRDGIILFDFADELREKEQLSPSDAILHATKRRMRPILLTTFCASMGVVPMVISGNPLWMPMGAVICFGALISLIFIRSVMPVMYALIIKK